MSDTAEVTEADITLTPEQEAERDKFVKTTKRGFDVAARLKNRGLRRSTIVLYLDEELGPELGDAFDVLNSAGGVMRRERSGIIGELDEVQASRDAAVAHFEHAVKKGMPDEEAEQGKAALESILAAFDERIAELTKRRDEMIAELAKTGLTIKLRAVPPVIQKDCRRKAKETMGITTKNIPREMEEDFNLCELAHLLTVVAESVADNETEEVNTEVTYDDAVALMGYLPPGQFDRLDRELYKVQYADAISRSIESQEDFS